jgi:hypothetical protein
VRAGRVSTKITSGRSANAARKKPDVVVDIVSDSDSEELCLSSGPAKVARRPHGGAHTAEAPVTAQSQPVFTVDSDSAEKVFRIISLLPSTILPAPFLISGSFSRC